MSKSKPTARKHKILHRARVPLGSRFTKAEMIERKALGLSIDGAGAGSIKRLPEGRKPVHKIAISAPQVLNEAPDYGSAFSRGLRVELPGGVTQLLLSGTASISEHGQTLYPGGLSRPALAHLPQPVQTPGKPGRHLGRRRAHDVLYAKHRPRLRDLQ
jgi:hypothetical protein